MNERLCNSDSGTVKLAKVFKRGIENENPKVQMLLLRGICNAFTQPHGLKWLSNSETRSNIVSAVLRMKDIEEGKFPSKQSEGLRVAASTVFLNFAVALHKQRCHDFHSINAVVDMLEKDNDPASSFRLLVALGTMMANDHKAVKIARERKLLERLTKFLGRKGETEKVGDCAFFISKVMSDTN